MLYRNGQNLGQELSRFLKESENLKIYAPYIKYDTLNHLLTNVKNCHSICVRWQVKDLISGASDLEIYQLCKDKNIPLFMNNRLHLKVYLRDYSEVFLTSANISSRALNIPENQWFNYEVGNIVTNNSLADKAYFSFIEAQSVLITDDVYQSIKLQLVDLAESDGGEEFVISDLNNAVFLISSLPLTDSPELLFRIYFSEVDFDNSMLNVAAHDIGLYNIPSGLNELEFFRCLKVNFFNHPFVKLLVAKMELKGEMFFGEVKEFIHQNCADVPLPRRWEITENIKTLYAWLVNLSDGSIVVDIPYNYSQRIRFINRLEI
jgi:hypothetical protein